MSVPVRLLLVLVAAWTVVACGDDTSSESSVDKEQRELTVYAAASLTELLPRISPKAQHSFGGSDELALRIREGAPADVFLAASTQHPRALHEAGLATRPVTFARNELVLVVPKDNPAALRKVDDLARRSVRVVTAAKGVPVGDYTEAVLEELELDVNVVSREKDVKGVLGKVALGEADAGFVYRTDARAADSSVRTIELPRAVQPPIEFQAVVITGTEHERAAERLIARLLSGEGQRMLADAGFLPAKRD